MATKLRRSRWIACGLLALLLPSCATAPPSSSYYGSTSSSESRQYSLMSGILSALALPIYLPFKAAVCAVTVAFVVPATAVTAVTDPEARGWQREALNEGFASNCGPPWVP
jgi:hypothetical protein